MSATNVVTEEKGSTQKEVCLKLVGVGKSFGGIRANNDISLDIYEGERIAIIGPNGAGKTTLFNMISGEMRVTDGHIYMFGEDVTKMNAYKRVVRGLARTYQITALFWEQSVMGNVLLALMGTNNKQKFSMFSSIDTKSAIYKEAEELIATVSLSEKKDEVIKNLSYGEQRLVELLLALASKPKILCLDEPNAGLSMAESQMMIEVIKKLDRSMTILLIEHDMDMVFNIVERIAVLKEGQLLAVDTNANIKNNVKVQQAYLGEEE